MMFDGKVACKLVSQALSLAFKRVELYDVINDVRHKMIADGSPGTVGKLEQAIQFSSWKTEMDAPDSSRLAHNFAIVSFKIRRACHWVLLFGKLESAGYLSRK